MTKGCRTRLGKTEQREIRTVSACRTSFSLSAFPFDLRGNYVSGRFSTPFFITFLGLGLPAYFSNHSPFLREHIFLISFFLNEFPSLVCWRTVIHYHRPQGATLFQSEMGLLLLLLLLLLNKSLTCLLAELCDQS